MLIRINQKDLNIIKHRLMKKIELHFLFALIFITQKFIFAQYSNELGEYDFEHKELNVFVTAENTNLKLTQIESSKFIKTSQPLETEIGVFVNFQEFLGIGGAITDASAEVFQVKQH